MATPSYARSLTSAVKRLKLSTICATPTQTRSIQHSRPRSAQPLPSELQSELARIRLPKAVQATYLAPLRRRTRVNADTVCKLQLRSYNVRNLEVFTDFALRAAYFLNLSVRGLRSLPKKTERWTVPRSNFVHKKSQENFERITMGREIQIKDGHSDVVATWLAFLRKHQYYGVGMKANVWDYGGLDAPTEMDEEAAKVAQMLGEVPLVKLTNGKQHGENLQKLLIDEPFKASWGAYTPSSGATTVPHGNHRVPTKSVHTPGLIKKATPKEATPNTEEKEQPQT